MSDSDDIAKGIWKGWLATSITRLLILYAGILLFFAWVACILSWVAPALLHHQPLPLAP